MDIWGIRYEAGKGFINREAKFSASLRNAGDVLFIALFELVPETTFASKGRAVVPFTMLVK